MKRFYMVMRDSHNNTTHIRHDSYNGALSEAKRLCRKEHDRFFILAMFRVVQPVRPEVEVINV